MHTVGFRKVLLPKESPRASLLWFLSPIKKIMPPSEWATFQYCTQTLWHPAPSSLLSFAHLCHRHLMSTFCGGSDSKESAYNAGDPGSIPESGTSPGEGNGSPLQFYAWKIPWIEEPGGLQFMRLQRVGHNWATITFTFKHVPRTLEYFGSNIRKE